MPALQINGNDLVVDLRTKSKARFSFYVEEPFVLLHADWQEWNRRGDHMLNGYVTSDRKIVLRRLTGTDFRITRATLPIVDFLQSENIVSVTLQNAEAGERSLWFSSATGPKKVLLNAGEIPFEKSAGHFRLTLPEFAEKADLQIEF
jgi:ribosomal protein S18